MRTYALPDSVGGVLDASLTYHISRNKVESFSGDHGYTASVAMLGAIIWTKAYGAENTFDQVERAMRDEFAASVAAALVGHHESTF